MNRGILIKSCQPFRSRRDACQETWAGEIRRAGFPVWFVEGGHPEAVADIQQWVLRVHTGDGYTFNSMKLKVALKLLLKTETDIERVFIVDDDTFVHPRRWQLHEPAGEFECRLHYPQSPRDEKLNYGRPWATGGAGWWMSRRLCGMYAKHVTTCNSWDDTQATALAQLGNVPIADRRDLYGGDAYTGQHDRVAPGNTLITCHHVQPLEMRELYEATREL